MIEEMYRVTESRCLMRGEYSPYYKTKAGTAQGCNASPTLFCLFIDPLLKELADLKCTAQIVTRCICVFADDVSVIACGKSNMQKCIHKCKEISDKLGMIGNVSKCGVMCLKGEKVDFSGVIINCITTQRTSTLEY